MIGIYKWKLHIFLFFFSGVCQLFFYSTFFLSNEKNKLTSTKTMWENFKNSQFHSLLNSVDYANLWTLEFISKYCRYKNILTNSYHYSFITSEHYRHNASKQLFNKSACGPIKYNLLYINAIQLHFWNPVYNHYKDGSTPSNYTRHKHRWKTSRLEWMSPWPLTFDITRPLELQLTKKTIMYRVHKPSTSELWQWIYDIFLLPSLLCVRTWRATQEQINHYNKIYIFH